MQTSDEHIETIIQKIKSSKEYIKKLKNIKSLSKDEQVYIQNVETLVKNIETRKKKQTQNNIISSNLVKLGDYLHSELALNTTHSSSLINKEEYLSNFKNYLYKLEDNNIFNNLIEVILTSSYKEKQNLIKKLKELRVLEIKNQNFDIAASLTSLIKSFKYKSAELLLVELFHMKFKIPIWQKPSLISTERANNRYKLMLEEVEEYKKGVENNDLENIAKELSDILFATYGTILEHGLQNIIHDVFLEVTKSNMSKDYHKYKMIKGDNYFEVNLKDIINE